LRLSPNTPADEPILSVVAAAMAADLVGAVEEAHRESPIIIAKQTP
jgi:hypothetical protein